MQKNFVVTIARQYGCGGRIIGKKLSEKLGVDYYDNELIKLAAKANGVDESYYKDVDEKARSKFSSVFSFGAPAGGYFLPMYSELVVNDQLFYTQANIIKQIATRPCVIVGRCADYILRDQPNLVKIFLHADMETRKKRVSERYGIEENNLDKVLAKADKRRATYYNTYTDRTWGDGKLYDLAIDTSKLEGDDLVNFLHSYVMLLDK